MFFRGIYAQTTYNLYGVITDEVGRPIVSASVFIDGTYSDFDGNYLIVASLEQGDYAIAVSGIGFSTNQVTVSLELQDQVQMVRF